MAGIALFALFLLVGAPGPVARMPGLGWLLIAAACATAPMHWALLHEAMHGHLFADDRWNARGGRLLGILLGFSFEAVRFGHLAHHRHNRHSLDRPEVLAPDKSWAAGALPYYVNLLFGQAAGGLAASIVCLLPRPLMLAVYRKLTSAPDLGPMQTAGLRYFGDIGRQWRIRADFAMSLSLFAAAFALWGAQWPVLAACLLGRFIVLSLLDNAPHYGAPLDQTHYAPNMRAPVWVGALLLNGNLHGQHHAKPHLNWRALPRDFADDGGVFDGEWAATVLRQFKGPLRAELPELRASSRRREQITA